MSELTAEQVRTAIFNNSIYASYDGAKYYADGIGMQAIADLLNAQVERTCKVESCCAFSYDFSPEIYYEFKMQCGGSFDWSDEEPPSYCPNCGRKVEVRE